MVGQGDINLNFKQKGSKDLTGSKVKFKKDSNDCDYIVDIPCFSHQTSEKVGVEMHNTSYPKLPHL